MTLYWIIKTYFLLIGTYTSAIKLTTSSDRATAGIDFNFTCISNDVFVTFTRNHIDECENLGINSDGSCRFLEECNSNYTISCNFDNYTLTIPGSFDINTIHESTWSCSSYFGERISNEIILYVNVPITRVSIQSYPSGDDNPIKIVQGSRQRFTCASDGGRPASRIQWYLSGTNITGDSKGQTDICNPGCNGKVISSSALEYIGDNVDNRKKIYCTAVNIVGHIVRSYYIDIVILYGPMISAISDQIIQEGNTLRVISNIDANPVSMLVWWSSSSELSFRQYGPVLIIRNIQRTYSGYYTCHSMNTLIPSGQPSQNRTSVKRFYVSVQLLSANKAVKTNTIGIWFGSSLVALMAIAITGLCVYKYRKRQVPNVEENTNNRVYESTRNVQRNTSEADQHLYNDIHIIESDVENQKKKIDERKYHSQIFESQAFIKPGRFEELYDHFKTYEDIWDVRSKRPDHVYQNMKISDKEEKKQQKEKAIYVNLELKPSTFT